MDKTEIFKNVEAFLAEVGRAEFQSFTGFCAQGVTRAKREGVFPNAWFWRVRAFCQKKKIKTPENLFRSYEAVESVTESTAVESVERS